MNDPSSAAARPEDNTHAILNHLPLAAVVLDESGLVRYASERIRGLLGYSPAEIVSRPISDFLQHPEAASELQRLLGRVIMEGGEQALLRLGARAADGRTVPLDINGSDLRGLGAVGGVLLLLSESPADGTEEGRSTGRAGEMGGAQQSVRESEERYRKLVEISPEGMVFHYRNRILSANRAAARHLGANTPEDLVGLSLVDRVHPEHRQDVLDRIQRMETTGEALPPWSGRIIRLDGKAIWTEVVSIPYEYEGSTAFLVVLRDLTERSEAEQALRENEERYRMLFEENPTMLFTLAPDGTVLGANRASRERLGYRPGEMVGFPFVTLFHPDDRDLAEQYLKETYESPDRPHQWELRKVCKEGETIWARDTVRIARHTPSGPVALVVCTDITEQRQAKESLQQNEARYRQMFEQHTAIQMLIDPELNIVVDVNLAAAQFYGYTREQMRGMSIETLYALPIDEVKARRKESREKGTLLLLPHRTANGDLRLMESHIGPLQVGEKSLVYNIAFDVTREHEIEEQVRSAQKMEVVGRLAGGIAHDFNNVITAIGGFASLIEAEGQDEAKRRYYLAEIQSATRRAGSLTHQLLAFSRKQVLNPVSINLNSVLEDMEGMLQRLLGEDVELITLLDRTLPNVHADPAQMEQVVMNLLVNARDAMPEGGRIIVRTSTETRAIDALPPQAPESAKPGVYVVLMVRDNGTGIPEEIQSSIFEPFFTNKKGGTGLGLSTVYGIVEQSGGWVLVESTPGAGATFRIFLPATEAAAEQRNGKQGLMEVPGGSEFVLLVEDEAPVRRVAKRILEKKGYTVLEASNSAEAERHFEEYSEQVSLLITDIVMPGGTGTAMAARMREKRPNLKVLYMSGHTSDPAARAALLHDGSAFLQKPFTLEQISQKVHEVLHSDVDAEQQE